MFVLDVLVAREILYRFCRKLVSQITKQVQKPTAKRALGSVLFPVSHVRPTAIPSMRGVSFNRAPLPTQIPVRLTSQVAQENCP